MTTSNPHNIRREPVYLKRLHLKNIRCFEEVEISFARDGSPFRPVTLIVGENSAGKTTLLRSLILTLVSHLHQIALVNDLPTSILRFQRKDNTSQWGLDGGEIDIELSDEKGEPRGFVELQLGETLLVCVSGGRGTYREGPSGIFVCGYGVGRAQRGQGNQERYDSFDAVRTIFRDDALLLDPEKVLLQARLAEMEATQQAAGAPSSGMPISGMPLSGTPSFGTLQMFKKFVQALTPITDILVGPKGVTVEGPWGAPVPLQALGDGYRGIVIWLLDYLARAEMAGAMTPEGPAGILLLDEIDEHLHPLWRRKLVGLLREHFPRTQFIGTTHSAITLLNCEPDEIVACKLRDGVATVTQDLPPSQGRSVQELLSGEWFGLEAVVDDTTLRAMSEYKDAVARGEPEERVAPLRRKVRDRLGVPPTTLLDELAIRAAALVRSEQDGNGRVTETMVQEAAARLRAMLKGEKVS